MNKRTSTGLGLVPALGLLFIGLKLVGTIQWSWVWVLAPFWAGPALLILATALYMILMKWSFKP